MPVLTTNCQGVPASTAQLGQWFKAGATSRLLSGGDTEYYRRECHALTGCTPWQPEIRSFFKWLLIQGGSSIVMRGDDVWALGDFDYPITNGVYVANGADVLFTQDCARATAHVFFPGEYVNTRERICAATIQKP